MTCELHLPIESPSPAIPVEAFLLLEKTSCSHSETRPRVLPSSPRNRQWLICHVAISCDGAPFMSLETHTISPKRQDTARYCWRLLLIIWQNVLF